jgi:ribosome-associated heat shock protein Hsp15
MRLDVWLDVACLFPTRSKAAAACKGGKVGLNGHAAASHKLVKPGDTLVITFGSDRRCFIVRGLCEHHVPKAEARKLWEETTPSLPPEVLEARRLERMLAPRHDEKAGRLSKKQRRDWERARGW